MYTCTSVWGVRSLADAHAAMIQAQIYREWGVAIVKGSGRVPTGLLECPINKARQPAFVILCVSGKFVSNFWKNK